MAGHGEDRSEPADTKGSSMNNMQRQMSVIAAAIQAQDVKRANNLKRSRNLAKPAPGKGPRIAR
jgi:hypothetical protein